VEINIENVDKMIRIEQFTYALDAEEWRWRKTGKQLAFFNSGSG
jgi:hypothetical protein